MAPFLPSIALHCSQTSSLLVAEAGIEDRKTITGGLAMVHHQLLEFESRRPVLYQIGGTDQINRVLGCNGLQTFFQTFRTAIFENGHVTAAAAIFKKSPHRISQPAVVRWGSDVRPKVTPQAQQVRHGL